jgi:single-strand DNA-binding protein
MATKQAAAPTASTAPDVANQVYLRGTFAAEAVIRELPSGDQLCSFRVTVVRPPGGRSRVDSIDCVSTKAGVRRAALRRQPGDLVEVSGSLRRRFWRSPAGVPTSRYEVEVSELRSHRE